MFLQTVKHMLTSPYIFLFVFLILILQFTKCRLTHQLNEKPCLKIQTHIIISDDGERAVLEKGIREKRKYKNIKIL